MRKDFDLDRIGKRMPYKTPEGCFDEMEANIWSRLHTGQYAQPGRKARRPGIILGVMAAAACAALVLLLRTAAPETQDDGLTEIEQAFADLSAEDQAYMLDFYMDDIFMNE